MFEVIYHLSIYIEVFWEHTKYFCYLWRKQNSLFNHKNNDRKAYFQETMATAA